MKRQIIKIDDTRCNGCGACIINCPEGALQIIDGKARLISEIACDGLGACIGHCPEGAIVVEEREAEPYNEKVVVAQIQKQGNNVLKAHLIHLKEHNQTEYYNQAIQYLKANNLPIPELSKPAAEAKHFHNGCPGSRQMSFNRSPVQDESAPQNATPSALTQWPIQLHLISPRADYFQKSDLLIAADCTAFSVGNFHSTWLAGRKLTIACPKLDDGMDIYTEKIKALIDEAQVNTITVMIMEVPCCGGLLTMVRQAASQAKRKVPIKKVVVTLSGEIAQEQWV
jgi:NAD-dependent dihydropyrimidine dehydrogenase PreA subunit